MRERAGGRSGREGRGRWKEGWKKQPLCLWSPQPKLHYPIRLSPQGGFSAFSTERPVGYTHNTEHAMHRHR